MEETVYSMVYLFARGVLWVMVRPRRAVSLLTRHLLLLKRRVQCVKMNQCLIDLVYPCTNLFLNLTAFTISKKAIILKIFAEFMNNGIKKYLLQTRNVKNRFYLSNSSLLLFTDRRHNGSLIFNKILQQVEVVTNISVCELVTSLDSFHSFILLSRVTLIKNELSFCLNFLLRFSYVIHVYDGFPNFMYLYVLTTFRSI